MHWHKCSYCDETIHHDEDLKTMPDDLPDDMPWVTDWDLAHYHSWCFESAVSDWRQEIAMKHGDG